MEPNEEQQGNDKKAERLAKLEGGSEDDNVCSRRLLRKEKLELDWEGVEKHGKKDC